MAVFSTIAGAEAAVARLLLESFTREEISVVCSDETKERYFREFEHQTPSGKNTPLAAAMGGAIGATVGGLSAVAAGVASGTPEQAFTIGAATWTGGILGGFVGAMLTRGGEHELADYYDQAVVQGKILVGVDVHGDKAEARRGRAAEILASAGAEPLPLEES
jgi:hypothetical protein